MEGLFEFHLAGDCVPGVKNSEGDDPILKSTGYPVLCPSSVV
jgi:hypothetical protein